MGRAITMTPPTASPTTKTQMTATTRAASMGYRSQVRSPRLPTPISILAPRVRTSGAALPSVNRRSSRLIAADAVSMGGFMAKFHSRPSNQYRYEHYDPKA
jgi:hypothetical protein